MISFLHVRPCDHPSHRASLLRRLGCALAGLAVVAVWNPLTHPGPCCCLLRRAVGLPCPLCGMTRGLALGVRGRFLEATWYNPLAVPLLVLTLVLCVRWTYELTMKKSVEVIWNPALRKALWAGVYVALLATWVYLLAFRREDDFAATWLGQWLHLLGW